jgi:hypothetical protein
VSLESQLAALTSGAHITEVRFDAGERVQTARLDMQSNTVTFAVRTGGYLSAATEVGKRRNRFLV